MATVGTLFSFFAIIAVALEAPVAATVFGAMACCIIGMAGKAPSREEG